MITIKFDTHVTKADLLATVAKAPAALAFGNNYAGVTYRPTPAGIAAREELTAKIKAMRNRELVLSRDMAHLLRILVTVYNHQGWTTQAITDRNLPVIVALYQAGIKTNPVPRDLPYYN